MIVSQPSELGFSLSSITSAVGSAVSAATRIAGTACNALHSDSANSVGSWLAMAGGGGQRVGQGISAAQNACQVVGLAPRPPAPPAPVVVAPASAPASTPPSAPAPAPVTVRSWPRGSYHVARPNGRYDIYAPSGTLADSGLGDTSLTVDKPLGACLFGDCGLGAVLVASDVETPEGTPPRPIYKHPAVIYGGIAAGGLAVLGGAAFFLLRGR